MNVQNLPAAAVLGGVSLVCCVGAVTLTPALAIPAALCGLVALAILFPGTPGEYAPARPLSPQTVVYHTFHDTATEARNAAMEARLQAEADLRLQQEKYRLDDLRRQAEREAERRRAEDEARRFRKSQWTPEQRAHYEFNELRAQDELRIKEEQKERDRRRAAEASSWQGFGASSAFAAQAPSSHPQATMPDTRRDESHGFGSQSAFRRH